MTSKKLFIRHCTLVPGIDNTDGTPQQPDASLIVQTTAPCRVTIEESIIGGLRVVETATVMMHNSILDATADDRLAYAAPAATAADRQAGGTLTLKNCTVRGALYTIELQEVSNSILQATAPAGTPAVLAERQQAGCIRFSAHLTNVRLPRRYRCVPQDLTDPAPDHPVFTTTRFGRPGYFQLQPITPASIRQGAEDNEEMGVYHDLYQELRARNLRYKLDEYLRFGLQVGIFYAT
ncbi:MAG: hypothetical protein R2867_26300 [Caldilineaceae bacterium]